MLYERPGTLDEALALMGDGTGRRVLAGGTDLYPATVKQVLTGPLLDISGVAELRGIARTAEGWRIGAGATWTDVIRGDLPPAFDALREAAREVGSVQIQNAATVMGNLCNASPAADGVPCLMAMEAEVELASAAGRRRLALSDFILGNRRTAMLPGEMAVAIHVPAAGGESASAFEKLGARRYLVISIAMVAVRVLRDGDRIARAAVAVGACSEVARRLPAVEAALTGQPASAPAIDAAIVAASLAPIDDVRATASYRAHAAAELVRRAVLRAAGECP